jgi:exonuclease SbcC
MTRLKSLYVKDFRSIDGEVNISLDAPIVLIHGPNGAGKTSLLSAMELALTGTIPSLSRAEPDYLSYLPHKDRPFGEVRLELTDDNEEPRSSTMRVTTNAISGSPLLTSSETSFFSERSYLAQSTLGRLLEIYQHSEKKSDSPLTRFVKELLGLDRLDAIIEGLHTSGNVSRLKKSVPLYSETRDLILENEIEVKALMQSVDEAQEAVSAKEIELKECMTLVDPKIRNITPTETIELFADISEENDLNALARARRELTVSQETWNSNSTSDSESDANRSTIEATNQSSKNAFAQFNSVNGPAIELLLDRAAAFFADTSVSRESNFIERAQVLRARVSADHERAESVLDEHEKELLRSTDLSQKLREAKARLERLDREIAAASKTNEVFARSMLELTSAIEDDTCPVCDRDFTEVSDISLSAHLAEKVAAVVEQAGRLQSLTQSHSSTRVETAGIDRELQAAESRLVSTQELTTLKTRIANLNEVDRQIAEARPQLEEGELCLNLGDGVI